MKTILLKIFICLTIINLVIIAQEVTWTNFNTVNSDIPDNYISDVTIDIDGGKWFGTFYGGLAYFDNTNWTSYTPPINDIPNFGITKVAAEGTIIWCGTAVGLVKFDGSTWTLYDMNNSSIPENT